MISTSFSDKIARRDFTGSKRLLYPFISRLIPEFTSTFTKTKNRIVKKLIATCILTACLLASFAQEGNKKLKESQVPAEVKNKFGALYPGTKAEKFEKENNNYEIGFHLNKTKMTVVIDPSGNLLETEAEIPVSELPKAVTEYLARNRAGKKITEASKITDSKGVIVYEAEVDKMDLTFDQTGKFIRESKD
jgi:hypothetical protein